jgi:HD-GYP domain-containing protein (c-di-GMP phosphodiesterase class II)
MTREAAVQELRDHAGTQFDERIVDALARVLATADGYVAA